MPDQALRTYFEPTQEAGRDFFTRNIQGPVVMLNLMRFRSIADYSCAPEMAPASPITGEAAYQLYMDHTLPFLQNSGGEVVFYGAGGPYLIGPGDERWEDSRLLPLLER